MMVALNALTPCAIRVNAHGWYVSPDGLLEECTGFLRGGVKEFSDTIAGAIQGMWRKVSTVGPTHWIEVSNRPGKGFRWNGFMWEEVERRPVDRTTL